MTLSVHVWSALAQTSLTEWSPLGFLSFGSLMAMLAAAIGYGRVSQTVKMTARSIEKLDVKVQRVEGKVNELDSAMARIEGQLRTYRRPPRGGGLPGPADELTPEDDLA